MTAPRTLAHLIESHGVDVLDHLDRQITVPVVTGPQCQGDVIVLPTRVPADPGSPVPPAGVPVVRGEAGGHTHTLLGDGPVTWAPATGRAATDGDLGTFVVPDGAAAWLAHPEHAYTGIGPGVYVLRRQREMRDRAALVAD